MMTEKAGEFTRTLQWTPAFDKRSDDPKKNYGIHGLCLRFILQGPKGATQFCLSTNWQLPHVLEERLTRPHYKTIGGDPCWMDRPMPTDLGYHSPVPQYAGQGDMPCDLLEGGRCYYDGSTLRAEPVFHRLVAEGDAGVWAALEDEYRARFEVGPAEPALGEMIAAITERLTTTPSTEE